MSLSIKICMIGLFCVIAGVIVKQIRPDFLPFVRVAGSIAVVTVALTLIVPSVTYIKSLLDGSGLGEFGGTVLKTLGIAVLTQLGADVCRDFGEGSIASGIEFVGRLEMLVLCFPLIEKLISTVKEVMSWTL